MYPNLYYAFKDFFGVEWHGLKLVNSFGFFVAIAFLVAAYVLTQELKRKQQLGLLGYTEEKIMVGAPASMIELGINFLLGFVFGYKIIGAFIVANALNEPQSFIMSSQGFLPTGLLLGGVFVWLKWREKNKEKLAKPEERIIRIWPHDRVGDLVIFAAIFGFSGAKLFDILESPANFLQFLQDVKAGKQSFASILFSGLTFYGGLICAGLAIVFYARKYKIAIPHLADAFAPALMLAYAIGRIGCHISGDGDWGILNSAFVNTSTGAVVPATVEQFNATLLTHQGFYIDHFKSLEAVKHISVQPFWHLPNWLFAYNYPHNVINEGVKMIGCDGQYCSQLPLPVFPTAFYEVMACTILFAILWATRKHFKFPGQMFGFYFILNGIERFTIEKIRVNAKYEDLPFQPTQAEVISSLLIIAGVVIMVLANRKGEKATA